MRLRSYHYDFCGCLICMFFVVLYIIGMSFWTDSNLDFWFSQIKNKPIDVPYWISLLATIFLNGVCLPGNIIASLCKLLV